MTRVVAVLYDSRAEAETGYARLSAEAEARNLQILSKETLAAVDKLDISPEAATQYRGSISQGAFLLTGDVATSENQDRIVRILKGLSTMPAGARALSSPESIGPGAAGAASQESRIPIVEEQLRVGKKEVLGGGARVRTVTRDAPVEQTVSLREEHLHAASKRSERRLTLEEVQSGGLLKDRVIQVSEMREEPVIVKEAYVREEIVLSKSLSERTQVIRDTVRRTEVDVERFGSGVTREPR